MRSPTCILQQRESFIPALFVCLIHGMYSYIDDIDSVDELDPTFAPSLMCLVEEPMGGMGPDEKVKVGMVVISASTGDVVWDEFEGKRLGSVLINLLGLFAFLS